MSRFDIPQSENSRKTGRYLPVQHRYSSSKQPRHFAAQMRGTIRRYAPYVALNLNQGPDDSGLRPYIADLAIFENTEFHCSKENHMYPHHRWEWETKPLYHLQKWD